MTLWLKMALKTISHSPLQLTHSALVGKLSVEGVHCQGVGDGSNHLVGAAFDDLNCWAGFHQCNGDEDKGRNWQIDGEHFLVLVVGKPVRQAVLLKQGHR